MYKKVCVINSESNLLELEDTCYFFAANERDHSGITLETTLVP